MDRISRDEKTGMPVLEDQRVFPLSLRSSLGGLEKYYRMLEEGVILGQVCRACGYRQYPPGPICRSCSSRDLEERRIEGVGRLLTYTEINVKPKTHSHYPDYIVGVAEVGGFKVLGLVETDFDSLKPDMEVRLEVRQREPEGYHYVAIIPV